MSVSCQIKNTNLQLQHVTVGICYCWLFNFIDHQYQQQQHSFSNAVDTEGAVFDVAAAVVGDHCEGLISFSFHFYHSFGNKVTI